MCFQTADRALPAATHEEHDHAVSDGVREAAALPLRPRALAHRVHRDVQVAGRQPLCLLQQVDRRLGVPGAAPLRRREAGLAAAVEFASALATPHPHRGPLCGAQRLLLPLHAPVPVRRAGRPRRISHPSQALQPDATHGPDRPAATHSSTQVQDQDGQKDC